MVRSLRKSNILKICAKSFDLKIVRKIFQTPSLGNWVLVSLASLYAKCLTWDSMNILNGRIFIFACIKKDAILFSTQFFKIANNSLYHTQFITIFYSEYEMVQMLHSKIELSIIPIECQLPP